MGSYDDIRGQVEGDDAASDEVLLDGWQPEDVAAYFDGERPPEPEPDLLGVHTPDGDEPGRGLFYRHCINELHGDSGTGKSWVAAKAAQQELAGGGVVLWVDLESTFPQTMARMLALGASEEALRERFVYVRPQNAVRAALLILVELIACRGVTLVVVDSLGEAFACDAVNEDRDDEVGPWTRAVLRPISDLCMVVVIDHSTKAKDNPLYPSGSKRKRASWTGAGYLVEASPPFSKDNPGWLTLTVAKDRHGARPRGTVACRVHVEPAPNGELWMTCFPPLARSTKAQDEAAFDAAVVTAIGDYLNHEPDTAASMAEVEKKALASLKGGTEKKRASVDWAVRKGYLAERRGPRNARLISWVRDVETDADDDLA